MEVPSLRSMNDSTSSLSWALEMLPPSDRIMLIPLEKEYQTADIARQGFGVLLTYHRVYVEKLKAAAGPTWKILLLNAEKKSKQRIGYYGDILDIESEESIVQIFDEQGDDCTTSLSWLKDVVNFDDIDLGNGEGMLLESEDSDYNDSWGECVRTSSTSRSYRESATMTKWFKSSFICVRICQLLMCHFLSRGTTCLLTLCLCRCMIALWKILS